MKKWIAFFLVFFLVIVIIFSIYRMHALNERSVSTSMILTRGTDIYPSVQVNGELYEWRKGSAIIRDLPDGVLYYGELIHVEGVTPNSDSEFVSVFDASGQIYITENSCENIYICLTTSWLESAIVIFDHVLY